MKTRWKFAAMDAVVLPLSACEPEAGQNETVGTLPGAICRRRHYWWQEAGDGGPLAVGIGTLLRGHDRLKKAAEHLTMWTGRRWLKTPSKP